MTLVTSYHQSASGKPGGVAGERTKFRNIATMSGENWADKR